MATWQIVPKKSKTPQADSKFYRFIERAVTKFPSLVIPVQFFAEKLLFPLERKFELPSADALKGQGREVRDFAGQVDYPLVPYILEEAKNCPDCGFGTLLFVHSPRRVECYDCFSFRRELYNVAKSL